MTMEKGIILQAAEISFNKAENSITVHGNTNAREIRKSLLYWDKIAIPKNNFFSFGSEDIQLLLDQQLAEEININLPSNNIDMYRDTFTTQLLAYQKLQEDLNTSWTLGQYNSEIFCSLNNKLIDSNIIEIKLINALPCPPDNTPIFEILEFKEKHRHRIQLLQYEIEEYTDEIVNSLRPARAEDKRMGEIKKILMDIQKTVDKSWAENLIPSFQLGISLSDSTELFKALSSAYLAYKISGEIGNGEVIPIIAAIGTGIAFAPKKENFIHSTKPFDSFFYMEKQFPGSLKNTQNSINASNEFSRNFLLTSIIPNWNQPRNSQCWCASGHRFKNCHGRLK
jgi:hypothetical protein